MSAPTPEQVLLARGLVTSQQIDFAWRHLAEQPPEMPGDLLSALVELGFLKTADQQAILQELASPPEKREDFAQDPVLQILLQENHLQKEDLQKALELKRISDIPIREGTAVLEIGAVTQEMIQAAMKQYYQKNEDAAPPPKPYEASQSERSSFRGLLGQILVNQGFIQEEQLQKALNYQYHLPRSLYQPLGEILVSLGFLSSEQLEEGLAYQALINQDPLTQALISQGMIEDWQLSYARSLRNNPEYVGLSLSEVLLRLGYASEQDVALLRQDLELE